MDNSGPVSRIVNSIRESLRRKREILVLSLQGDGDNKMLVQKWTSEMRCLFKLALEFNETRELTC